MATAGSVRYKIEADSSDLVKEGKKVERALDRQEQDLKQNRRQWQKVGNTSKGAMREARKETEKTNVAIGNLKKGLAALGIAVVAKQAFDLAGALADSAKAIEDFHQLTGLSRDELQQMEQIGRRLQTDFRDIADAQLDITESINQTIVLQDKQRIEAYNRLGIGQAELRELTNLTGLAQIRRLSQLVNQSGLTRDEQITVLRDAGLNEQRVLQLATRGEELVESTRNLKRASDDAIKAFADLKDTIADFVSTAWAELQEALSPVAPELKKLGDELIKALPHLATMVTFWIEFAALPFVKLVTAGAGHYNRVVEGGGVLPYAGSQLAGGEQRPSIARSASPVEDFLQANLQLYWKDTVDEVREGLLDWRRSRPAAGDAGEGTDAKPVVVRLSKTVPASDYALQAVTPGLSGPGLARYSPLRRTVPGTGGITDTYGLEAVEAGLSDERLARQKLGAQIVMEQEAKKGELSAIEKTTAGLGAATQALGILDQVTGGSSERIRKFTAFLAGLQAALSLFQTVRSIFGFASGGFTRAGLSLVGEYGPELISSDRQMYVHNPLETQNMMREMGRSSGGGGTTINISSLDPEGTLRLMNRYYPQFKARMVDDFTRPGTENTLLQGRGY